MRGMILAAVVDACAVAAPSYAADAAPATPSAAPAAPAAAAAPAAPAAAAAADTKPVSSQQQKMKDCNAEAKTKALKGADRKAFMKTCLSKDGAADAAAAAPAAASPKETQQQKMKDCNAEAKTKALKGADRKTFMSTCLKG